MSRLGGGGTQPRHVALVYDGTVQDILACGQVEVVRRICHEAEGLEGGELVDGRMDGPLFERLDGHIIAGYGRYYWRHRGP